MMNFYQRVATFFTILSCIIIFFPTGVFASELIGYWRFDETSGNAVDSSGNLPDLANNNVTYGAGQYGNAAYFNGTTAFFVGTGPDLNGQSFTFSAWLWREAGGGQEIYFSQGSGEGSHNNLHLRVYDDGLMRFGFLNNDLDTPAGTFVMGQWNHVVLTYDADTNARKIYLNGGEAKASDTSISDFIGNSDLNIGRWIRNGGDQYWTGRIDDLKIYNRALTDEEVADLTDGGAGPGLLEVDQFDPADNATGVSLTANLTATFSTTTVATSTGSIGIYRTSDDSLIESIAVSSSQITKSGSEMTINPSVTLENSTEYYVWIPSTAFKDVNDVFYEGTTASTTWSFTTLADGDAPVISNIATSNITNTGVTITWDTDESASTKVVYSIDTSYASTTAETDTSPRVTDHSQAVSDLLACTTYNYRVVSRDATGNSATSSDATFTTIGCPETEQSSGGNGVRVSLVQSSHLVELETSDSEESDPSDAPARDLSVCSPYIKTYIRYGADNDPDDVKKLETFLNEKQGESLVIDGVYGDADVEAVKRFQQKYVSEVLGVWGLSEPTGYVYRTTLMKINSFYCSASVTCPAFTQYNSLTENSESTEVFKTKTLLSELGFYTGVINSVFDAELNASLRSFQETFSETMLKPWGLAYGTGYKYKTTNKFLNMLVGCKTDPVELDGAGVFDY